MADVEKKYYYVCHHLQFRPQFNAHGVTKANEFRVFDTEKEAVDRAIEKIRFHRSRQVEEGGNFLLQFDETRARGLLATQGKSNGDSLWIQKDKERSGERLTIIRTTHPERYSHEVEKFLNLEL